jgi:hypothetical protein
LKSHTAKACLFVNTRDMAVTDMALDNARKEEYRKEKKEN